MADLERYLDGEGKYAWRVKKKVDEVVEQVDTAELPKEVIEAEAEIAKEAKEDPRVKPKKRRK